MSSIFVKIFAAYDFLHNIPIYNWEKHGHNEKIHKNTVENPKYKWYNKENIAQ